MNLQSTFFLFVAIANAAPHPVAVNDFNFASLLVKYNDNNNNVNLGQYSFLVTESSDYTKLMSYYQTADIITPTQIQSWLSDYYEIATDPYLADNPTVVNSLLTAFPTQEYYTLMSELFPTSIVGSYDITSILESAYGTGTANYPSTTTVAKASPTITGTSTGANTSTQKTETVTSQQSTSVTQLSGAVNNGAEMNGKTLSAAAIALSFLFSVALII